jgi:hypothetical protein
VPGRVWNIEVAENDEEDNEDESDEDSFEDDFNMDDEEIVIEDNDVYDEE